MRSALPVAVLCLGVATDLAGQTTHHASASAHQLEAMLLPPVDGQLALWINQPANFAVLGVAQGNAYVLYQQTGLEGVPANGYIYVPRAGSAPDVGYDQIYLVASRNDLDLSGRSLDRMTAQSSVIDAYQVDVASVDTLECWDPQRAIERKLSRPFVIRDDDECRRTRFRHYESVVGHRGFFTVEAPHTTPAPINKPIPIRPQPKPGYRFAVGDEQATRWIAAQDQWHAIDETYHATPPYASRTVASDHTSTGGGSSPGSHH